jgi:uncharacterized DUF497 family protein
MQYGMNYQWDNNKTKSNLIVHGVDFADAVGIFEDLNALTIDDPHPYEQRFISIGLDFYPGCWWFHIHGEAIASVLFQHGKQQKKNAVNMR